MRFGADQTQDLVLAGFSLIIYQGYAGNLHNQCIDAYNNQNRCIKSIIWSVEVDRPND